MREFDVLHAFGVRVREVPDLAEGVLWLRPQRLLLIDASLSPADRDEVACQILGRAVVG